VPLLAFWLTSAGSGIAWLLSGRDSLYPVAAAAGLLFILTLIWHLTLSAPHAADLPDLEPSGVSRLGFWGRAGMIALGVLVVLLLGLLASSGLSLLTAVGLIALGIVTTLRREVSRRVAFAGLAAGGMVGLGIRLLEDGQAAWAVLHIVVLPPTFVAGALLAGRSRLADVRLLTGQPWHSLNSAAWGCVLALPAALLNLAGNLQAGDAWVVHWWQVFAALNPAIAEEIWARLFLTTLVYVWLRPVTNDHPRRSLVAAVLLGAGMHAAAHTGINPIGLVIGALLYGVPAGLLFIKRDLEHAIGYHFGIDAVRYAAALSGTI
jgi:hypothetical protein